MTSFHQAFRTCSSLTTLDVSDWDVSGITSWNNSIGGTFHNCTSLTSLDCTNWRFSTTTNFVFAYIFNGCSKLTTIGDTSGWNLTKCTSIEGLFYGCSKLESVDVSDWDVSNSTSFALTFSPCLLLTELDVSLWDVSKSTNFFIYV